MFNDHSNSNSDSSYTLNPKVRELYHQHQFSLTDYGNAQRFAEAFGESVRYIPTQGWFLFSQTHWQLVDMETMLSLARQSLEMLQEYSSQFAEEEAERYELVMKHLARCESLARLQALLRLARTIPAMRLPYSALDGDPFLLNLRNGTLDLRSGELVPHNPQHYLTRLLPYDYTPEASMSIWETFLDRLTNSDADLKHYLQRAVGATLFGASNESTCFILTGAGQRAQQVFLSTLRSLLSGYATHSLALTQRSLTPKLLTSRLLTLSPSTFVRTCDPSVLSALLNHDPITLIKASTELIYQPRPTLWLSLPELPQLPTDLASLSEFIQPIPITLSLKAYEAAQLKADLLAVLPAILNWAIEGFQLWYTEAPNEPACIQQASASFREEQDPLALFLAQSCIAEPEATIPSNTLYKAYLAWARDSSERPLSTSRFSARIFAYGLEHSGPAPGRLYRHLKLVPPNSSQTGEEGQAMA